MYSWVRDSFLVRGEKKKERIILKYDNKRDKMIVFCFKSYSLVLTVKGNILLSFIFQVLLETGRIFSLKLRTRKWMPNLKCG